MQKLGGEGGDVGGEARGERGGTVIPVWTGDDNERGREGKGRGEMRKQPQLWIEKADVQQKENDSLLDLCLEVSAVEGDQEAGRTAKL